MWTYNYIYPSELYHHGIKGQRWGVRRYQNSDGSLTPEGQKHYNKYKSYNYLRNQRDIQGQKLMNRSKGLSSDFGGSYKKSVDDDEFFELTARTDYGLDTSAYIKANQAYKKFVADNRKSINIPEKLAKKIMR